MRLNFQFIKSSIQHINITKFQEDELNACQDLLVTEEPLEIRINFGPENDRIQKSISVTMRTPGHDFELAMGFLLTEGIIKERKDVIDVKYCQTSKHPENIVKVSLSADLEFDIKKLDRHFYTTSSCGICGKASLDAIENQACYELKSDITFTKEQILSFPDVLKGDQLVFKHTGGIHAAGLFDNDGKLIFLYEDIGRHNAVDKVIGAALMKDMLPLSDYFILVSGRAGFELVQKSITAGIPCLGSIGAPSSLSVELAKKFNMTLVGFIREKSFNVYCGRVSS